MGYVTYVVLYSTVIIA